MAMLAVNPTRMELRRLKNRLKTAERGHKLLKDKSDEMVRRFMSFARENKQLRVDLEPQLKSALNDFMLAKALTPLQNIVEALSMPSFTAEVITGSKNIMGIDVPALKIKAGGGELIPYGLLSVSSDMDKAIVALSGLIEKLLYLAEVEKTCNMLAIEIEKNRRRVNALEYVMIPQLKETIKYIRMKLDENERATIIRLIKVKSLIQDKD